LPWREKIGCNPTLDLFLRNMNILKRMPFKAQQSVFTKLEEIADIASLTKEERMKYDESIKNYRDKLVVEDAMKREAREVGMEEGRKVGMEQGLKEGKKEGIKEGKRVGKEKIAKTLKSKGFSIEEIAEITTLSVDVIEKL
jgi:predicted transposase/invertase (TIGR01784 family)